MSSMTDPANNGDRINDTAATIEVADGHVVHTCCGKLDAQPHENFCEHYRHPVAEARLLDPPACPDWCTQEHRTDRETPEFRDCDSEEMFVPDRDGAALSVNVGQSFNRTNGAREAATVFVGDYKVDSRYARHLARLLVRAADLIDG